MKITQEPVKFKPVIIILETQQELDCMTAILDNTLITEDTPFENAPKTLIQLGGKIQPEFDKLDRRIREYYKNI